MSIELRQAAQQALKALEAISDEMTTGERYTNAGQYLLDALGPLRAALSQQPAQSVNEKHFGDFELLVVTTAYEQGFGHAFRTELSNPYALATNAYKAWDMGRSAGKRNGQPQQPATGEPVYWEWRHLSTHPDTVDFGKWSKWQRVEARSAIHTIDDALAEFRAYIAQGYKCELRALYTHPAPSVPAAVVRDAERGRFLIEWLKRYGLLQAEFGQIGGGEKPENWWLLHAPWCIDKTRPFFGHGKTPEQAIDAAMLAAK